MRTRVVRAVAAAMLAGGAMAVLAGPAGSGVAPVVQVTITKTVVGTDPGVPFAITLTCSSEGPTGESVSGQAFQIPNNGSESEVVHLANGESTVVNVQLPPEAPDSATCVVTEDLADTELPANIGCTAAVTPESAVVFDQGSGASDAEFTVTNTCSVAAVTAAPAVTG